MATRRNISPEVAKYRSMRAVAIRTGDHETAAKAAEELAAARIIAAHKVIAAEMAALSAETRARVAAQVEGDR